MLYPSGLSLGLGLLILSHVFWTLMALALPLLPSLGSRLCSSGSFLQAGSTFPGGAEVSSRHQYHNYHAANVTGKYAFPVWLFPSGCVFLPGVTVVSSSPNAKSCCCCHCCQEVGSIPLNFLLGWVHSFEGSPTCLRTPMEWTTLLLPEYHSHSSHHWEVGIVPLALSLNLGPLNLGTLRCPPRANVTAVATAYVTETHVLPVYVFSLQTGSFNLGAIMCIPMMCIQ